MDEHIVQQVEGRRQLHPIFADHELVLKLSCHFMRDIQVAVYTQGIKVYLRNPSVCKSAQRQTDNLLTKVL